MESEMKVGEEKPFDNYIMGINNITKKINYLQVEVSLDYGDDIKNGTSHTRDKKAI